MKAFVVLASVLSLSFAEPPSSYGAPSRYQASEPQYGVPAISAPMSQGGYGVPAAAPIGPSQSGGYDTGYGVPAYTPQVYRHVYVHAAPDEPQFTENKVIRVPGGGDKHVNIIFVKAPSHSSNQQTEVILPEQPQQKTVVYVLVKKPESYNNVKVTAPAQVRPSKPEVFFIRYKDQVQGGYGAPGPAAPAQGYGAPAAAAYAPVAPAYSAPSAPAQGYGVPSAGYQ